MPKMPKKIIVNKTIAIPETLQFIIRQTRFTQEDTNNFRRLLLPVNQTNENQFIERPNWPWTHFHNQRLGLYNAMSEKERKKLRTYQIAIGNKNKKYTCTLCEKTFTSKQKLRFHIKDLCDFRNITYSDGTHQNNWFLKY